MIRILFLLVSLCIGSLLSAQEVKRVQLPVTSATVFTNGAQVNMTGKVTLPAGRSQVFVEGITTSLIDGTLQAMATGKVMILSITREEDKTYGIYTQEIQKKSSLWEK